MFEPFPGNYVWNLATNLALIAGGNHGEIDEANRPLMEAAKAGADAGSAVMFDSWIRVADQVAANAAADEAAGFHLSAGTKYLRASGYYLAAERMQSRDYAPRWAAYDKGLDLYHKGSALRGLHVDKVEVPYGDSAYSAIFVHDGSGTPRPTLVSVNGLDSMKEQVNMAGHGASNLERGMNTLFLDQPGTGEAIRKRNLPAVFDAERWGSPAFDYLLSRPDVIASKIGVFGLSFGGYHAPRIAANDPRYALCAVMGANHVWGQ
ncbi:MAG: alpha/beta hydrolase, partial [Novosphingobium sp.]|nr:alpha/beta hydrolase [Novosphingobium sp.]